MKAQITPPEINTPWQQLKQHKINLESALNLLVDRKGTLALDLLDSEVSNRFLQQVANQNGLPPVIPLLLWRCCYYLASPIELSLERTTLPC